MTHIQIKVDSSAGDVTVEQFGPDSTIGGDPKVEIEHLVTAGLEKLCGAYEIDPYDLLLRWQRRLLNRKIN